MKIQGSFLYCLSWKQAHTCYPAHSEVSIKTGRLYIHCKNIIVNNLASEKAEQRNTVFSIVINNKKQ